MPLKRLIQRNLVTSRDQFSDFAKGIAANLVSRFAKGKATSEALQRSQQKTPPDSQTQNVRPHFQDPARVPSSLRSQDHTSDLQSLMRPQYALLSPSKQTHTH